MRIIKADTILFDRYKITERLGGGGQSFVFKAEDLHISSTRSWQRTVFIKQYSDLLKIEKQFPKVKKHFDLIAERVSDNKNFICYPNEINICRIHGSIIAVFPFIPGLKLSEIIKEGLEHDEKVRIAFALVNAVRKLHENGIAHLDLKPDNIVISKNTQGIYIKLIDLDGSKIDGESVRENIVKTPGYSSPEHFGSEDTNISSDIFSLGITILELLTDKYPFSSTDDYLHSANKRKYSIEQLPVHWDIIKTLFRCLEMDPRDRPSAGKVLSIFNRHHDTKFLALADHQKYYPERNKCSVKITLSEDKSSFSRIYYEDKTISSNDLRGSGVNNLSGDLFFLRFMYGNAYLYFPPGGVYVPMMDDLKLSVNKFYLLLSKQVLSLGGNKIILSISYFE